MTSKRTLGVTLLLWMVLILSAWGITRFVAALQTWDVLNEFESSLSPLYLSITGAGWGLAGGIILSGIWRGKPWARSASVTSILIWLIEYWLERVFFQTSRANLPFALSCSIFIIAILWTVSILPGTKSFFTKSEEHEQPIENPDPE